MSREYEDAADEEEDDGKFSVGKIADHASIVNANFPPDLREKFEIFSYRNAANILAQSFPEQYADITSALTKMAVTKEMVRMPGGSKGLIAKHIDTLFTAEWIETRISADLKVKLLHAKRSKN
jgi:hypothetical protein